MKIYQVDAFTDQVFSGNPAAVCPLNSWLPDQVMEQIAMENNLSETAFFVKEGDAFHIRWFTPEMEIDLCGHATLASAHVIFNHINNDENIIAFKYRGGDLFVTKNGDLLSMDFPSIKYEPALITDQIVLSMGRKPKEAYSARDLMVVYDAESDVMGLQPNFNEMSEIETLGIIATAPGDKVDFVSRFFAPRAGINEDPVTGSAHCMLIPFWADRLKKNRLEAMQLSKRRGVLSCEFKDERVVISGKAITYMIGEIMV